MRKLWILVATGQLLGSTASTTTQAAHDDTTAAAHHETTLAAHDAESLGEHVHPHAVLLFPVLSMLIGLTITHVTSRFRWLRTIPYTVSLLLVGVCLGFLDVKTSGGLGTLSQSLSLWVTIDPHLLLYAFLPVLLFGDAMSIVWHDFRQTAAQCLVLAGPGVLIGTSLIYLVAKYVFPYGWDHFECAAFGSILAATDPVAVVGLLKEMGASRVLTMQIAGESLLNDGTAIVVWLVFYNLMKGEEANAEIVVSFIRLALGGVVFGAACGLIGARWMSLASNRLVHSDSLVQVSLTLAVAYISFFAGENELKLSGVLATIFAALMVGKYAQPLVCDKDALAAVWHLLEFFGNTVLFVLCGVFAFESAQIVRWSDYGWLLVFYILANLARGFMIGVLWPLVNCVSGSDVTRTTWKEVLVMTWGGLRGAVGLALVLSMRELLMQQGKQETARLMVFFVSGFAALTLLVNATTCSLLLKCLGLTKTPEAQSAILERLRHELFVVSRRAFTDSLDCDGRFKAVKEREINHMLEHLNAELDEPHEEWSMKLIGAGRWTLSGLTVSNNINPFAVRPAPEGAEPEKQEEKPEEKPEAKPEEKQDKGRTGALGAAPRRSSIQAWDHHWWWGFEEIKVDREATWTRQTSQERQAGQAAPGSHQEREVFRKLFMSMLRAEYVRLMDVGMLPRRASGAEHLLASVDAADDWAAVRLNDWTILEKKLPRRASWIRVKVREMLSPYFVFCPVEINGGSHFFDLFTVVAFIDAHHTVCHGLLQSDWFSTDARSDVIEESLGELEAARKFLKENRVGERDISKVRTLQLASMLFQTQQDQVEKWKQQGIISAKEMEELLHLVKHGLDRSEMILKKQVLRDEEVSPKSSSRKMTFSTLVRLLPGR